MGNDSRLSAAHFPQLIEELAADDSPRLATGETMAHRPSARYIAATRRSTVFSTVLKTLGQEEIAAAHDEMQDAMTALRRVRNKTTHRIAERMEIAR